MMKTAIKVVAGIAGTAKKQTVCLPDRNDHDCVISCLFRPPDQKSGQSGNDSDAEQTALYPIPFLGWFIICS